MRLSVCLCIFLFPLILFSLPQNPVTCSGDASFEKGDNNLAIHVHSDTAIIHWDSFSICEREETKFLQNSAESSVLNRVYGNNLSEIHGHLVSNGKLFLINENGILVGPEGRIDTSSFIASTLNILDERFLDQEEMFFSGDSLDKISNFGTISAWDGDVILIGPFIENVGEIHAPRGTASLTAGVGVLLKCGEVTIRHTLPCSKSDAPGIDQSGLIKALQAELRADGNLYKLAINHTGMIEAKGTLTDEMGNIYLSAEEGHLIIDGWMDAKSNSFRGGEIQILGKEIELWDHAFIDASGNFGGGNVYIGGNIPASPPHLYASSYTSVSKEAYIIASSKGHGNGGTINIWSDGSCFFEGILDAKGKMIGGDGGTLNVGGKDSLCMNGSGDTLCPFGKTGTMNIGASYLDIRATDTPSENVIDAEMLIDNLHRNNIGLVAMSNGESVSDLRVMDPIVWEAPTSIDMQAEHDVIIQNDIVCTDPDKSTWLNVSSFHDVRIEPHVHSVEIFQNQVSVDAKNDISFEGGSIDNASIYFDCKDIYLQSGHDIHMRGGSGMHAACKIGAREFLQMIAENEVDFEGGSGIGSCITIPGNAQIIIGDSK